METSAHTGHSQRRGRGRGEGGNGEGGDTWKHPPTQGTHNDGGGGGGRGVMGEGDVTLETPANTGHSKRRKCGKVCTAMAKCNQLLLFLPRENVFHTRPFCND